MGAASPSSSLVAHNTNFLRALSEQHPTQPPQMGIG
jgi:hypothetical protein